MVEEVIGGILKMLARFISHFFLEIIFEILLKGPGYIISKKISKSDPDPDGFIVILIGILFWFALGALAYSGISKYLW
jgi:hypothetical protein